jgi:hypothetical protein
MEIPRTPLIVDLPEGLLLLATDDATGRIDTKSGALDYGVAGAMLTGTLSPGASDPARWQRSGRGLQPDRQFGSR